MADDTTGRFRQGAKYEINAADSVVPFGPIMTRAGSTSLVEYASNSQAGSVTVTNQKTFASPWTINDATTIGFLYTGNPTNWKCSIRADIQLTIISQAAHDNLYAMGLNGTALLTTSIVATRDKSSSGSDTILPTSYKMEVTYNGPVVSGDEFTFFQDCSLVTATYEVKNLVFTAEPW